MVKKEDILKALEREDLKELKMEGTLRDLTRDVEIDEKGNLVLHIFLPRKGVEDILKIKLLNALNDLEGLESVKVKFYNPQQGPQTHKQVPQIPTFGSGLPQKSKIPGVKRVILVGSGKGGVGKSTVAANLAYSLQKRGYKVGLLDADIYGPSAPTVLGLKNAVVTVNDKQKIVPVDRKGLKVLSIGLMLPSEETPVIWRGALLMKAIQQFIYDVDWGELDYLIVDLPPGTGDVQLTLAQNILIDGAIVVTTPQDVALADVKKAVSMFQELGIPVMGIVENMAYYVCPRCGEIGYIFGKGRVENYAKEKGLEILTRIPLESGVSEASDRGLAVEEAYPESLTAKAFKDLAEKVNLLLPV